MIRPLRLAAAGAAAAAVLGLAAPAAGADPGGGGAPWARPAVFVMTDDPGGNAVVAFDRRADGTLVPAGTTPTGGRGGRLDGAVVDPLASQGSLTYDPRHGLLLAANAGSGTVTTFAVWGDRLVRTDVVGSGGSFPVSIAVHGDLAAVLDAGGAGAVALYRIDAFGLHLLATESLGLTPVTGPSQFVSTPGQVGFTPDGDQLVVTTKADGSDIDLLAVGPFGRLGAPVVNPSTDPVPFAFVFDGAGDLVVGAAGDSTVDTYRIGPAGTLVPIGAAPDGQAALCWLAAAGGTDFAANAGSASVTGYQVTGGEPSVVSQTPADAGPIDLAATPGGSFLYVESGGTGAVDEFAVGPAGTLEPIGSVPVHSGLEGIAVS